MREYQRTYYRYIQASEKYDQLVRAYATMKHSNSEYLSHMEKNLRQMIKKAYIEKNALAEHARECLKDIRKPKVVKFHLMADSETADQWA